MIMVLFSCKCYKFFISLTDGLLWTPLVYVLDDMEVYKVIPLIFSLMLNKINKIPRSCPVHITHMMLLYFATFSIVLDYIQKVMDGTL